jgi:hypothetical protein
MYIPKDLYDELVALPHGTDVTEYFEFSPGWDLKVTTGPAGATPGTDVRYDGDVGIV